MEACTTSDLIPVTSSQTIVVGPCLLWFAGILPNTTHSAILAVYDNASAASGTQVALASRGTSGVSRSTVFISPVYCKNGITVSVTGTLAQGLVTYQKL